MIIADNQKMFGLSLTAAWAASGASDSAAQPMTHEPAMWRINRHFGATRNIGSDYSKRDSDAKDVGDGRRSGGGLEVLSDDPRVSCGDSQQSDGRAFRLPSALLQFRSV